jgi:MraZ protein
MSDLMPQNCVPAEYAGRFRHTVDRSHRVALPVCWRPKGAPLSFVVARWPVGADDHLLVLTPDRWQAVQATLTKQSLSDPKATALIRQIGSTYARVALDKVGRLPLPDWLARDAGIDDEALLLGLLDRFEIWHPKRYGDVEAENKRLAAEAFKETPL